MTKKNTTDHQGTNDPFIPVIPMEDDLLHTSAHLFCSNPSCGCHEDPLLIGEVAQDVSDGLMTGQEASRKVQGKTI